MQGEGIIALLGWAKGQAGDLFPFIVNDQITGDGARNTGIGNLGKGDRDIIALGTGIRALNPVGAEGDAGFPNGGSIGVF